MTIPMLNYPSFRPYTNVQPFTVRDGATYLLILEGLKDWIRDTLVPHIDSEIAGLTESWDENVKEVIDAMEALSVALIARIEAAEASIGEAVTEAEAAKVAAEAARDLAEMYASQAAEIQDQAITTIWNDENSSFHTAVMAEFDALFQSINADISGLTTDIGALSSRVTVTESVTDGTIIPVEAFGAVGDGVTNDTPAINAAIASGKRIKFRDGVTYRLGSVITGSNIDVDADGAFFLIDHGANGVQMNGVMSDSVPVNSWTQADEMTSVSGGPLTIITITAGINPPATWKRGDVVVMASDDILPYSKDASSGDAALNRCGQWLRILSVNGSQIKAMGQINDPQMLTNLRIAKVETIGKFKWRGGTFDFTDAVYDTGNGYTFFISKHVAPIIRDVTIKRIKSGAVYLRTCHSWLIDGINVGGGVNDISRGAYGYGVANFNGAFGILSNSYFTDVRHSYTNGSSFLAAGGTSCDGFGRPHDNLITDCITESASATAYDSHTQGRRETFNNCHAYNCSGFGLRGTYHMVRNGHVFGGKTGFSVFIETASDRSYGHIIDGFTARGCENIGVMTVNKRGGAFDNVKETIPNIVRNVVARGIKGRPFIGDNTSVVVSDVYFDNNSDASSVASLFSNSDVWFDNFVCKVNTPTNSAFIAFAVNGVSAPKSNFEMYNIHISGPGAFDYFVSGTTIGSGFRAGDVFMFNLPTIAAKQSAYSVGDTAKPVVFT